MVSNSVSKYYWLWFGIRAYVQMGVLLHWKIPIQLLFLFPRESLSVPAFRTLTYTKTKQQQHSLLASGLPTSSSLPLPTIFTRKQHRNHVQDCPRPCCCYCFRLGFCPGPKVCCFVKMLRVEIRPHEVAVGLSGFFVPRSNHCSLNCGLHRPLLSLLWGQVGKVWAHYCRGVVVNWTWQLITHFFFVFLCFPLPLLELYTGNLSPELLLEPTVTNMQPNSIRCKRKLRKDWTIRLRSLWRISKLLDNLTKHFLCLKDHMYLISLIIWRKVLTSLLCTNECVCMLSGDWLYGIISRSPLLYSAHSCLS